jgi:iron complex outermembrane recepter protein
MNNLPQLRHLLLAVSASTGTLVAQTVPTPAVEETVLLSPFTVSADAGNRYQATEATSGTRVRVSLFDSPQTVSVVTRDLIDDIAPGRILDAAKYVAGVTESTIPNAQDRTTVRGFQSDGATVDGFSYFSFANLDPVLIERIEVVKGPNAILAPQGIPGGTINSVSKKPFFQNKAYVSAEVGRFSSTRAELDINRVLVDGKFAFRLAAAAQDADDYADRNFHQSFVAMPMIAWRIGPSTQLTFQAQLSNWWATNYLGLPLDPYVGTDDKARLLPGISEKLGLFGDDITRHQSAQHYRLLFTTSFTEALSMRLAANFIDSFGQSAQININTTGPNPGSRDPQTGKWVINPSVVASRTYTRGGGLNTQDRTYGNLQNDFAYELRTDAFRSTTVAGYAINYAATYNETNRNIAKDPTSFNIDAYSDVPYTVTTISSIDTRYSRDQQVYLSESLTLLDDRLTLSGGVSRNFYDLTRKDIFRQRWATNAPNATLLSYGILGKILPSVALFHSYSEQGTAAGPDTGTPIAVKLTSSEQKEYGARIQLLENKLYATVTYFDITQNNFSVPNPGNLTVPAPVPPLPPLYSDRTAKGWEFELNAALSPRLSLVGNYTDFKNRDPNGMVFRGTAEQSGAVWLNYSFESGTPLGGLSVGIGADYLGKRPGDIPSGVTSASTPQNVIPNHPTFYLPSRTLVNLNVSYRFNAQWRARLNIENLLDEDYLAASINRNFIWPGTPINARLTVAYHF